MTALAVALTRSVKTDGYLHVQEQLGECLGYLPLIEGAIVLSEQKAEITAHGTLCPALGPLQALRYHIPRFYERMVRLTQVLGAGGILANPTQADLDSEIGGDIRRYYRAPIATPKPRSGCPSSPGTRPGRSSGNGNCNTSAIMQEIRSAPGPRSIRCRITPGCSPPSSGRCACLPSARRRGKNVEEDRHEDACRCRRACFDRRRRRDRAGLSVAPVTIVAPFRPAARPMSWLAFSPARWRRRSANRSSSRTSAAPAARSGRPRRARRAGRYTLLIGQWSTQVVNPVTYALPYEVKDFEPIALLANTPQIIIARKDFPAKDVRELIAWLKANPDKAEAATVGAAGGAQVAGMYFQQVTGPASASCLIAAARRPCRT